MEIVSFDVRFDESFSLLFNLSKMKFVACLLLVLVPSAFPVIFNGKCPQIRSNFSYPDLSSRLLHKVFYFTEVLSEINHIFTETDNLEILEVKITAQNNNDLEVLKISSSKVPELNNCQNQELLTYNSTMAAYTHSFVSVERKVFFITQTCGSYWDRYIFLDYTEDESNSLFLWGCVDLNDGRHEEGLWVLAPEKSDSVLLRREQFPVGSIKQRMLKRPDFDTSSEINIRCILHCKPDVVNIEVNDAPFRWTMFVIILILIPISVYVKLSTRIAQNE